ncbi:MAG: phosphate transport system regulatory protein PhoU [Myxococcales bacterium]|nr:phosphate transport system regulatory protein PhoU [Myxococcales bacterium]
MTATRYARDMRSLRELLLRMGGHVEEMLGGAAEALVHHDVALARQVRSMDRDVNRLEYEVDALCLRILGLHHPSGGDLRFVAVSMKLVTHLERMGDLAKNISDRITEMEQRPTTMIYVDLPRMSERVRLMISGALDAFVERDVELAEEVVEADSEVDDLYWRIHRSLEAVMLSNPEVVSYAIKLLLICKYLERLGDHAANIAEEVIFFVEGRDVRRGDPDS